MIVAATVLTALLAIAATVIATRRHDALAYEIRQREEFMFCAVVGKPTDAPASHFKSLDFQEAICIEQICSSSYLRLIWPRHIYDQIEDGAIYDVGVSYRESEIDALVSKARNWWTKSVFRHSQKVRVRLDQQLSAFCRAAEIAKCEGLPLVLVFVLPDTNSCTLTPSKFRCANE